MASLNKVIIVGNITRDPELKYIPNGTAVTELNVAVNEKYTTKDGTQKEEVCFVSVVVWGKQAENCSQYLSKGSSVLVEGKLIQESWEKDGKKQTKTRVKASLIQFLNSKPKTNEISDEEAIRGARNPHVTEPDEEDILF